MSSYKGLFLSTFCYSHSIYTDSSSVTDLKITLTHWRSSFLCTLRLRFVVIHTVFLFHLLVETHINMALWYLFFLGQNSVLLKQPLGEAPLLTELCAHSHCFSSEHKSVLAFMPHAPFTSSHASACFTVLLLEHRYCT